MSIGILGSGAFGTALAIALAKAGREVILWSRDAEFVRELTVTRKNARHLPGAELTMNIRPTADISKLKSCEAILLAVPAQSTSSLLTICAASLPLVPLVICAKGIEKVSQRLQSEIVSDLAPNHQIAALTGPGFAQEIAAGLPTALTLACEDSQSGQSLQALLSTPRLRLYLTNDIRGAQLAGSLKNVVALACGMVAGAALGESARAALMTRGFAEMSRLAMAMGAKPETLSGLSGLGDLALTCNSAQSRNFANGFALGQGKVTAAGTTVEGIATAFAACELARKFAVEMPIANAVAAVIEGKISISSAMDMLLTRPLRTETIAGDPQ